MARYTITRACGHTEDIQIYGTNVHGQREQRAAREAQLDCADCVAEERRKHNAEATRAAANFGLVAITGGSPKQNAWAESIRLAALADLDDHAHRLTTTIPDAAARVRVTDTLIRILIRIAEAHLDARWWIDNRANIGGACWREMTDADRRALQAAQVEPQPLDDEPGDEPTTEAPETPQAAIATLRANGWSAAKIAANLGVHRSTVYRWANGQHTPNARNSAALTNLTRS